MEEHAQLTVSFLPTKQDYADYQLAAVEAAASPKERLALRAVGFLMVVTGFVLCLFFGLGDPYNTLLCSLLVLAGLAVGFYHDAIQPLFVRSRAQSFFDRAQERMTAQTLLFYEDRAEIRSDRYEAALPYALLYGAYEDKNLFLLRLGPWESRYIPKRALSGEDCETLHRLLQESLQEKFVR
ncbi:YcxB family protein [Anaeromassilibacillus senegalensis]|uniref:YcxB family protein n=1 Tax=Anaeromassilibacillus senegalensis TaxID=1673717 RepID=UPI0006821547|nr:YcxB family protein [Anaeromassilibacillus senegalensis]